MGSNRTFSGPHRSGRGWRGVLRTCAVIGLMAFPACGEDGPQLDPSLPPVDLSVTQVVDDATPGEGALIQFVLTVRNDGPNTVTTVVGQDELSSGLTYDSHSIDGDGTFDPGTMRFNIPSLAAGAESELTLYARSNADTEGSSQSNEMIVVAPIDQFFDPDIANNQSVIQLAIGAPPPPPPPDEFNNEPAGFVALSDWHWPTHNGGGWSYEGENPFTHSYQSVVSSGYGEAPPSGGANVLQATYLAGVAGGFGPGRTNFNFPGGANEVFVGMWHKFPANYIASDNSNKMWFFFIGNTRAFLGYRDLAGQNPRRNYGLTIDDFGPTPGTSILGNPAVLIPQGEWYKIEWHVKRNTPGNSDGFMKVWINGVQTHNVQNLTFPGSMVTYYVEGVHNGLNNQDGDRVIPEEMHWWLARVRISTPP